jgi:RNA polymerase sigma factor (sigma-70 family)
LFDPADSVQASPLPVRDDLARSVAGSGDADWNTLFAMNGSLPVSRTDIDHEVVEGLVRRHRPALLRYFQRKGIRPPDDEDAVQEVFVRLARRDGLATEVASLDAYIFAAAAHVATDLHRWGASRASGRHDAYDEALHAPPEYGPDEVLEGRQALNLVRIGLKELPERTRTVFVLARLEHMRHAEIARRLGISVTAIEKHLHRAVAHLAQRVERPR